MGQDTVLPARFGALLAGPQQVCDLLAQGHAPLSQGLASMDGLVEMEVAATWDLQRVLQEIGQTEDVLRAKESIAHPGPTTIEQRAQVGQLVRALMGRQRAGFRERMASALRSLAVDSVNNALLSDELVMNAAFLVQRERQEAFEAAVSRLDLLFEDRLNFRVIGPLPPYSFATVHIASMNPRQLSDACTALGLEGDVSEATVRRAFRRQAAELHHLTLAGDSAGLPLANLRRAHDLLLGVCKNGPIALDGLPGQGPQKADNASLFAIEIRRVKSSVEEAGHFPVAEPMLTGGG